MQALEQTPLLNSPLLDPESEFGFGFGFTSWSPPDSNDTGHQKPLTADESRRLRRMKSNCESARRSRMRKRIYLDQLRVQFDQLQAQNHDLRNRLGLVSDLSSLVQQENRKLQMEALLLKRRLDEAQTLLLVRRLRRVNAHRNFRVFGQAQASALASLIV